jgi:UPF0042 nucleotide-binding protein
LRSFETREDLETTVLFLEASDAALQRRYSETQRPHPLGQQLLSGGGDSGDPGSRGDPRGAQRLASIRKLADVAIDTSEHTVHSLRSWLEGQTYAGRTSPDQTEITVLSFGFKHGDSAGRRSALRRAISPNPHFIPELRDLTGNDAPVVEFLENERRGRTRRLSRFNELLDYLMPLYQREGKSYVTVAIGCTGGKHRSVALAERAWASPHAGWISRADGSP